MNAEQFVQRFLGVLFTEPGWEKPLTMERLHELLTLVLAEYHQEIYR
jgi:hypothetical protein